MTAVTTALVFISASAFAALAPLLLGHWLWPEGLDPRALFIFRPASGVNLALALIFGRRFIPLILRNVPLGIWLLGEPSTYWPAGIGGNASKTLFACGLSGRFRRLDGTRGSARRVISSVPSGSPIPRTAQG